MDPDSVSQQFLPVINLTRCQAINHIHHQTVAKALQHMLAGATKQDLVAIEEERYSPSNAKNGSCAAGHGSKIRVLRDLQHTVTSCAEYP